MVLATDDLFQFWVARFNSPENLDDIAYDLEVDDAGNVYVTGICDKGGWLDVAIIKYNSERNSLWQRYLDVDVQPYTMSYIELDSEDNVYVSCTTIDSEDPGFYIVVTRKYDSLGTELWEASSYPYNSYLSDLEVDDNGNVYVARDFGGIMKYDTYGTQKWWKFWGNILDLEVDNAGNVYVTGSGGLPGETDIFVSKLDSEGSLLWYAYYGKSGELDIGFALTVDDTGNVYVAGMSWSGEAIIKYNSDGEEQWAARYAGTGWDEARSIAVDENGNVYVSGNSMGASFYDCLTVKYDSGGNRLWEARYDGPASKEDLGAGLVLDSDANVYVTCQSVGSDPPWHDYATIMYDTDGDQLWVERYDGSTHGDDRPQDIKIDEDGNVYVTGSSQTSTGLDFLTIKYTDHTASNSVTSLIYTVEDMELNHGVETSLVLKLKNILRLLSIGREDVALKQLRAFANQVEGIRGIKLTNDQADVLIEKTQEIIDMIQ